MPGKLNRPNQPGAIEFCVSAAERNPGQRFEKVRTLAALTFDPAKNRERQAAKRLAALSNSGAGFKREERQGSRERRCRVFCGWTADRAGCFSGDELTGEILE